MIIQANVSQGIPLADESVQCIITSPPYYALRNYGVDGQIGLEQSWKEWLESILTVMDECWRVLRNDGVLWLNLGDKYNNSGGYGRGGNTARSGRAYQQGNPRVRGFAPELKYKSQMGLPWRVAIAMIDTGWILRRDLIWHKPTAMPESCRDRPATSHEYIFQLVKSERYFWDKSAMMEPVTGNAHARGVGDKSPKTLKIRWPANWEKGGGKNHHILSDDRRRNNSSFSSAISKLVTQRQRRSVWSVCAEGFKGAHFATFPPKLIEPMLLASTRPGDLVLDPFMGAGTVGLVAARNGRRWVGCEIKREYIDMALGRIADDKVVRYRATQVKGVA